MADIMKVTLKQIKEIKTVEELKNIASIDNVLSVINDEIRPMSVTANTFEELFYIIAKLKKQWNGFSSDIYFKNDRVKLIYSLLYARSEVRNKNIGYSDELLNDANKAKKWYLGLTKKIHPDENPECEEEAQKAMNELETIYKRIQKCFVDEEE